MNEVDCAWLAGLLEGEGHFRLALRGARKYLAVSCSMTDEDVIRRIHKIVGVGNVNGPTHKPNRKPIYTWVVSKRRDVVELLQEIQPYMGLRRGEKIAAMLRYDYDHPLMRAAVRHGTLTGYTTWSCRCDQCRAAGSTYRKDKAERDRARALISED